jgi:hypothetical protein
MNAPDPFGKWGGFGDRPERTLLIALRLAMLPTLAVPIAAASFCASAGGNGVPFALAWPLAALAVILSAACWLRVIALWRRLQRPDDDDQGWWRRWSAAPLDPDGGSGGSPFDWKKFEQDFWSHVKEKEREREPVRVGAAAPLPI